MSSAARPVREDQHGTPTGYQYGCRCRDCRRAKSDYRRQSTAIGIGPDDPRHGTNLAYNTYGCRCEPCKQAHSDYMNGHLAVTEDVTLGTIRQWGMSLGLPISERGKVPKGLIDRWNREHPDRPYGECGRDVWGQK